MLTIFKFDKNKRTCENCGCKSSSLDCDPDYVADHYVDYDSCVMCHNFSHWRSKEEIEKLSAEKKAKRMSEMSKMSEIKDFVKIYNINDIKNQYKTCMEKQDKNTNKWLKTLSNITCTIYDNIGSFCLTEKMQFVIEDDYELFFVTEQLKVLGFTIKYSTVDRRLFYVSGWKN